MTGTEHDNDSEGTVCSCGHRELDHDDPSKPDHCGCLHWDCDCECYQGKAAS